MEKASKTEIRARIRVVSQLNLECFKKTVQNFFQEGTLTIVGSGLSMSEGIPGMGALADTLIKDVPSHIDKADDTTNWEQIAKLLGDGIDLESALHQTPATSAVEKVISRVTSNFIRFYEKRTLSNLLSGSHTLRFSDYVEHFNIRNTGIKVITTNYDRLIEFACEQKELRVNTLFVGRYAAKLSPEESIYSFCKGLRGSGNSKRLVSRHIDIWLKFPK